MHPQENIFYSLVEFIDGRWVNISRLGYDTKPEAEHAFQDRLKVNTDFRIGRFDRTKPILTQ